MFRRPYRKDPLLIGWAVVMAVVVTNALLRNTDWGGQFNAARLASFLTMVLLALVLSLVVLGVLAAVRDGASHRRSRHDGSVGWRSTAGSPVRDGWHTGALPYGAAPATSTDHSGWPTTAGEPWGWSGRRRGRGRARRPRRVPPPPPPVLPWTDRWLRDWREAEAQERSGRAPGANQFEVAVTCRHGSPVDDPLPHLGGAPFLRSLSVSHHVVRPGSSVSVTWCFERAVEVTVDGRGGHPSCGEALVQVPHTRRIEVVGVNEHGRTAVSTASVVAVEAPQVDLPTVSAPPPLAMSADVRVALPRLTPAAQRLDDFWTARDRLRPASEPARPVIGVPDAVIERFRTRGRSTKDSTR